MYVGNGGEILHNSAPFVMYISFKVKVKGGGGGGGAGCKSNHLFGTSVHKTALFTLFEVTPELT